MGTPRGAVSVTHGDAGKATVVGETKDVSIDMVAQAGLFENFNPALVRTLTDRYDHGLGGVQAMSVYVIPATLVEVTVEASGLVEVVVGGRDAQLERYDVDLAGIVLEVLCDGEGRVLFIDVPEQYAYYARSGWEFLRQRGAVDPLLSAPVHEVVIERDHLVRVRDGVGLATDLYFPDGPGPFPVVLVRTPYGKALEELRGQYYARRGYVFAVQDCRGRFASEGIWEPFVHEADDGYDTIVYLGEQPWSSGKVGMIGASYVGWVQWWAARDKPPYLATIIPNVAPPEPFFNIPYEYGAFFLLGSIWWAEILESEATADLSGQRMRTINERAYAQLLRHLPVIDLDEIILGKENPYWRRWIRHSMDDAYWAPARFAASLAEVEIPVFHQSGWFDGDGIGSKLNYQAMAAGAGPKVQKLVLGPWGHTDQSSRRHGERDFGAAAVVDLQRSYLRWFDYWLKGIDNGVLDEPLVSLFVMGSNHWEYGETYPLPQTSPTKLYLWSQGAANGLGGDGELRWEAPPAGAPTASYVYDPGDPTPFPAAYFEAGEDEASGDAPVGEKKRLDQAEEKAKRKAHYNAILRSRRDILVYETAAFEEEVAFVGPIEAVLYAATDAKDTDWFMRLTAIEPDGEVLWLVEGKIRARYRNSIQSPQWLEPGEVVAYPLDLWQTGIALPAGSKLRVEVASASFPRFSRNLNTGDHNETETAFVPAKQTIYHEAAYPSHVLLPLLPARPATETGVESEASGAASAP